MFSSSYKPGAKAVWIITSCFFLLACENDLDAIESLTAKKTSIEEGKNIVGYLSQQAKMKAKLTAPLMRRYLTDSPYIEFPNTLHVDFYEDSLKIQSQLDARYGRYKTNENRVFLKDSVVVFNTLGDTLHCMELWWDQHLQKYYTDKPVRIHRPNGQVLHGNFGMVANQDPTNIELKSGHGRLQVPDNGLPD